MWFRNSLILAVFCWCIGVNASSTNCSAIFAVSEQHFFPSEVFMAKGFYNGAFLLEFFGPMQNLFRNWLIWLESDDRSMIPPQGPGIYYGTRGIVIARKMVFPIDAGISEFKDQRPELNERLTTLMEFSTQQLNNMRGSSPAAIENRTRFLQLVDTFLFGLYGALKSDDYENVLLRSVISGDHTLHASLYPGIKYEVKDHVILSPPPGFQAPPTPLAAFDKIAEVVEQTERTVTVRIRLGDFHQNNLSADEQIIKKMFFITHWQMVQKSYRESGLFKDNLETALYLLDDFTKSMQSSNGLEDLYLMYDKYAWHSMRFRLSVAHRYVAIYMTGLGLQPFFYQTIADVFYPFYPIYGLAVENRPAGDYEFKRLFHNDNPDPLHMLGDPVETRDLSLSFYHSVAQQLPVKARITAVSKTSRHTRLYQRLGFRLLTSEYSPDWNSQKETLIQSREELLAKTNSKP